MNENLKRVLGILQSIDEDSDTEGGEFHKDYPNVFKLLDLLLSCVSKHDEEIDGMIESTKEHDWKLNALKGVVVKIVDDSDELRLSPPDKGTPKVEIN